MFDVGLIKTHYFFRFVFHVNPQLIIICNLFSDTVYFSKSGSQQTPAHNYSDYRFRTYASFAFPTFRKLFSIETYLFLASLCSDPMIELSNPGASGSIFYVTSDDRKESI